MTAESPKSTDVKLLPNEAVTGALAPIPAPNPALATPATMVPAAVPAAGSSTGPSRQLSELPKDELEALAEDFGLDATRYKTRQHLVAAIHERRQLIAGMDRDA